MSNKNYTDELIGYYNNMPEEITGKVGSARIADQAARECGIRRGVRTDDYKTFYIKAYKKDLDEIAAKLETSSRVKNISINRDFDGWGTVSFQV